MGQIVSMAIKLASDQKFVQTKEAASQRSFREVSPSNVIKTNESYSSKFSKMLMSPNRTRNKSNKNMGGSDKLGYEQETQTPIKFEVDRNS
jgi:hypothetical protein